MKSFPLFAVLALGIASQAMAEEPDAYDRTEYITHVLPPVPAPQPEAQQSTSSGIPVHDQRMADYADWLLMALNHQNDLLTRISNKQTAILKQLLVNHATQAEQTAQAQH